MYCGLKPRGMTALTAVCADGQLWDGAEGEYRAPALTDVLGYLSVAERAIDGCGDRIADVAADRPNDDR